MISLITPTHNPTYLYRLYESIKVQTNKDFEWVVSPNNGADVSFLPKEDWIRIVPYVGESKLIGAIKNFAFKQGNGEWLAEVDHDDEILPNCVDEIIKAAKENPTCDFIYSDTLEVNGDKSALYGTEFGWKHYDFKFDGVVYTVNKTFPHTPQSVSRIWYAPNHIRVWKKNFYNKIGGHNIDLKALDDQDLLCRTYISGTMHKIEMPLYKYHRHKDNSYSSKELNAWIQEYTMVLYDKYIAQLMEKWCEKNNLLKLDLAIDKLYNNEQPWYLDTNSVGLIKANDVLQRIENPIKAIGEMYRVLSKGGMILSNTPSTDGRGAFQDPTHVSFWNANSFWYYTNKDFARKINTPSRFQLTRIKNWYPSEWHKTNQILYTSAHMTALKGDEACTYAPGKIEI